MEKQPITGQCLTTNIAANEDYIKTHYPDENFITDMSQIKHKTKYSKGLVIPENVKVAESRIPINSAQRSILRKELLQAKILAKLGYSVYLTPEYGIYKIRVTDAVINGIPYEFRYVTGKTRQIEQVFSNAKKKGKNTNVFLNIESDISRKETRRRIVMVLERHPDYTGKIIVSWKGDLPSFWDTTVLR